MPDKNKATLVTGLILIVVSFLLVAGVVYLLNQTSQDREQKTATLEVQLENLMMEKAATELVSADTARVRREPVKVQDAINKTQNLYGDAEAGRKEGVLWIDRAASKYMITLGRVNGLNKGSLLTVFDGDREIAKVSVEAPLDLISYVNPVGKTLSDFSKTYYRITKTE